MLVGDVMTRDVLAIDPKTPLVQAIGLMIDHKVSGLPVVGSRGQLVGILTEGDLMRRAELQTTGEPHGWLMRFLMPGRLASDYVQTHGRKTEEVMTPEVITVDEATPLSTAIDLMRRHRVRRLPVVRNDKLVGIVSRADIVRRLGAELPEQMASVDDETIRKTLLATLKKQSWGSRYLARITVENGIVQLDGSMFDVNGRDALTVLAENVPGVRQVENRIVCVEPNTGVTF